MERERVAAAAWASRGEPLPGDPADHDFREFAVHLISVHENVHDTRSFDSCAASAPGLDWRESPGK